MIGVSIPQQISAMPQPHFGRAPSGMIPFHPQAPGVWVERGMLKHYQRENPGMTLGTPMPLSYETALQICPAPGWDAQSGCRMWGLDGAPLGAIVRANYYGPPFQDRALQRTYIVESQKLAESSAVITLGTARELVATVINSALAAAESATPEIERRVRAVAEVAAKRGAKGGVSELFLGGIAVVALGLSVWGVMRAGKR